MGFLDDLLGNTAADASKAAAADTYAKQQAAVGNIQNAGQQYSTNMTNLGQNYNPWIQTGQGANTAVQNLISNPSSVSSLPAYQFDLSQGTKALDHSAAAGGNLFSGKQGKALVGYGQNLADQTYGNQLSRLLGVSNQGLGAQGQQNAMIGQGYTGQLGANTSAYNGMMTDAGTIGQGNVAAANAKTQGMQNLFNLGGSILGSALGGGFGGGSAMKSLFGSSPQYGGGNFLNSAYGGNSSNPLEGLSASDYGAGF